MISNNVPIRKCIVCAGREPKEKLLMVVRPPLGSENSDLSLMSGNSKKSGRGYYICKRLECIKKARKSKRLERLFSKVKNVDFENLYNSMEMAVTEDE